MSWDRNKCVSRIGCIYQDECMGIDCREIKKCGLTKYDYDKIIAERAKERSADLPTVQECDATEEDKN